MENKEFYIEEKTTKLLLALGVPINLQGFRYLRQGIKMVINEPEILTRITKGLYPAIGEKYGVSSIVVERGIRHAIEVAYARRNLVGLNDIFDVDIYDLRFKPTNSEIIALLAERVVFYLVQEGYDIDFNPPKKPDNDNDKNSPNKNGKNTWLIKLNSV